MNKYMLITVVYLALSGSALFAQELRKDGRYYVSEIEQTFEVSGPGTLRIDNIYGDVVIHGWDQSRVFIKEKKRMDVFTEEEAKTVLQKTKSSYRKVGNDIVISGESFSRDWIRSKFVIQVPVDFSADVETSGGDIEIQRVQGGAGLRTSGGDITLDGIGGDVEAKTSGGDISVIDSKGKVDVKTSGGDIKVENLSGPLNAKTSGGDIVVSEIAAAADVYTSGGDVGIDQITGDLKAHTSGGDIEISNSKGTVSVHTSGGDIRIENIGDGLQATTSGGDINADAIAGRASVSTSGGDVDLHDVKGGVKAKTSGGDIEVEITLVDMAKPHDIDLRTSAGGIVLYIPEKLPAVIRAEIENSNRRETYQIYSDFPITISDQGSEHERRRFVTGEGEINGGGDLIQLYTINGDISIKKLER